jgi:hypothetical protein
MDIAVDVARTVVGYSAKTVAAPINIAHRFVGKPLRKFGDLQLEMRSSSCFSSPDDIAVDDEEDVVLEEDADKDLGVDEDADILVPDDTHDLGTDM